MSPPRTEGCHVERPFVRRAGGRADPGGARGRDRRGRPGPGRGSPHHGGPRPVPARGDQRAHHTRRAARPRFRRDARRHAGGYATRGRGQRDPRRRRPPGGAAWRGLGSGRCSLDAHRHRLAAPPQGYVVSGRRRAARADLRRHYPLGAGAGLRPRQARPADPGAAGRGRIALALDVSASMAGKMRQVSEALRHFIDLLEPADEIMVITFSADVSVDQDFTSDRDLLERVFSRLRPAQGTALYDAAIEAIHRVAAGPAESKAVVLVTDGMDTASMASFEEVRELARRSEVPIFSIGIGSETSFLRSVLRPGGGFGGGGRGPRGWPGGGGGGRGGWPGGGGRGGWPGGGGRGGPGGPMGGESDFDGRPLQELADDSGGRAEILKGLEHDHGPVDRLKEAVESIAVTLRHRYLVGYEPQGGKAGWRKIKVEVDRPSVTVQSRKGYYTEG
ncbi:MAG: hypothetical protein DMF80_13040 [Acidobacteria bacterium]|nr:MAG: hypothetical protein DMF80_13040 [Acidobacteriota bacterium]